LRWLTLLMLFAASTARADETDYLPDNPDWNGCSELASLARGMQLRLELVEQLDWSQLPRAATLLILYPTADLDPKQLLRFLDGGGRVLLADDFGRSHALLQRLGIQRVTGRLVDTAQHHNGRLQLPLATTSQATHELGQGVGQVVTNHPAFFRSRFPTLAGFGKGQQLMVAGTVGQGRFVALSDPSVLINGMLKFEGNAALARNILHYLRPPRTVDRMLVLTRQFRVVGRVGQQASGPGGVQRFLTDYSGFLGRMNDFAPWQSALRAMGVVGGLIALALLALLLPLPRRELSGHWLRPGVPQRAGETGLLAGGNAAFSAAVLRDEIEEILTEALQAPGLVFTMHSSWVVRRTRELAGAEGAQLVTRLLAAMHGVSQSVSPGEVAALNGTRRSDLASMYELSSRVLVLLGRDPLPDVSSPSTNSTDPSRSRGTK